MEKKINNGDLPAFACTAYDFSGGGYHQDGLTKREYFAAMAMQGILSNPVYAQMILDKIPESEAAGFISLVAIEQADNLITQLNHPLGA